MATSGPRGINLVTGLADAKLDSLPLVAITGQVPSQVIGTDAFQEAEMVGVTRRSPSTTTWCRTRRDVDVRRRSTSPAPAAPARC